MRLLYLVLLLMLIPPVTSSAAEPVRYVKVGLLLPLSGADAAVGNAMLDAATLSLFEKYDALANSQRGTQLQLIPRDTASGAGEAAAQAVEAGAMLLIGPLYAEDTEAAAETAREKNIPLLSFSNNEKVAGRGVYLLGLSPDEQTARIVEFLYTHKFTRVAALLPGDPAGAAIAKILNGAAANAPAPAPLIRIYPTGQEQAAVEALGREIAAMEPQEKPQALLIGEGGKPLADIASLLVKNKIDPKRIRLVGSSGWDDPLTPRIAGIQSGWFAAQPQEARADFEARYQAQFGSTPPRLAALAYDATALAYSLALQNPPAFTEAALTTPQGFIGPASGLFRLRPDGTNQHGLAILEIGAGTLRLLDPAPEHF